MSKMQRDKGASGERELARLLFQDLGETFARNLVQSRDGGADLITHGPLAGLVCEVKRGKRERVNDWWRQACEQAERAGGIPLLAYRLDRRDWRFVLPLGAVNDGFVPSDGSLRITVEWHEFIALARECDWQGMLSAIPNSPGVQRHE